MPAKRIATSPKASSAHLGFEAKLWLGAGEGDYAGANPEDKDKYLAANVFWVPKDARWAHLQANAKLLSGELSEAALESKPEAAR